MLINVPSAPGFLVDVFSFVVHAESEVGVLAPEEFRWKIFLGKDLEPLVVLVLWRMRLVDKSSLHGCRARINRDHRARLVSSNRENFAY